MSTPEAAANTASARRGPSSTPVIGAGILGLFARATSRPETPAVPPFAGAAVTPWFPPDLAPIAGSVARAAFDVRRTDRAGFDARSARATGTAPAAARWESRPC